MDLYIDKASLLKLLHYKDKDRIYYQCERLLRHFRIIYLFNKSELSLIDINLLSNLTTGRIHPDKDIYGINIPINDNDLDTQSIYIFDCKSSLIFNNKNRVVISKGSTYNDIVSSLHKIYIDKHYSLTVKIPLIHFSWNDISDLIIPCDDIIITDRYFLKNINKLRHNIGQLFSNISYINHNIKIVIFSEKTDNLNTLNKYIKDIKLIFNHNISVTIVIYPEINKPHDRFIISNYRIFQCGDSFSNLFNKYNKLESQGFYVELGSLAKYDYFNLFISIKNKLQSIINNRLEEEKLYNITNIFGDRISNILHF